MVKQVESISAELEIQPLRQGKSSTDGEIHLCQSESPEIVTSFTPLPDRGRNRESARVESHSAWAGSSTRQYPESCECRPTERSSEVKRLPRDQIWTGHCE